MFAKRESSSAPTTNSQTTAGVYSNSTTLDVSVMDWKEEPNFAGPFSNSEKPGYEPIGLENFIAFEEADVFDVPPVARATEIFGPLYQVEADGVFAPHMIDYISGALTSVSITLN
jgi:hypothetical protein